MCYVLDNNFGVGHINKIIRFIEMMKTVQRRAGQKGVYTSTPIVRITPTTFFMI